MSPGLGKREEGGVKATGRAPRGALERLTQAHLKMIQSA